MTQEQKELLLKDLCARLPYDVFIKDSYSGHYGRMYKISYEYVFFVSRMNANRLDAQLIYVKPYLRPMSSMTEEEKKEFDKFFPLLPRDLMPPHIALQMFNWLNAHHFDYRSLIEQGLAIEVTAENDPY